MKLIQLNIWMGKLLAQTIKFINQEQPDILCLQEVFSSGDSKIKIMESMFSSLESIMENTGYEHSFFAPTFCIEIAGSKIKLGNAILSKYPLLDSETTFTSGDFINDLRARDGSNYRNLQTARIERDGKSFVIANHHGYWDKNPLGTQDTIESLLKAADKLKTSSWPIVFAGDFNVIADSPAMRPFDNFLVDLTAENNVETTLSRLGKAFNVACDHVMVSPQIKVDKFWVYDELVSDHKALGLEFEI